MTKNLWQTIPLPQGTHYLFIDTANQTLKDALEICAAKAISLLDKNIQDDSLYLLFEWNSSTAELTIVVTDADKQRDSSLSVGAKFAELHQHTQDQNHRETALQPGGEDSEKINISDELVKFFISDYLASCSAFFRFSLVAIFHSSTRSNTNLL